MAALGAKFTDENGCGLPPTGESLERVRDIDISAMNKSIRDAEFTVMCDVDNPLLGENGATLTFGAQKGANSAQLLRLESGMENYAGALRRVFGVNPDTAGAGAAGGLGAALMVFLGAKMRSGIEAVLDIIGFDALLDGCDLVITGEGRMDWQSAFGKVPAGIAGRCRARGIPVVAIVGGMGRGAEKLYPLGIESIMPLTSSPMSLEECMKNAEELYLSAAERTFRLIRAGAAVGRGLI